MSPFQLTSGSAPILLSVPHCGVQFPDELRDQYVNELAASPDDTDWFVHELYDFAATMGIGMIHAVYSRWVIDLNRDPNSKPLYTDGRIITALCPTTNFLGDKIYKDQRLEVHADEVKRRVIQYYQPYHNKVQEVLNDLKGKHGNVLLWDCHSIRQRVPTIHATNFPDLILGDADGTSASPGLIEDTLSLLDHSSYSVSHNTPFKGGYITRHFGRPGDNQHALQLEMTKVNYMDASETKYDKAKASKMRDLLKRVFEKLIDRLTV